MKIFLILLITISFAFGQVPFVPIGFDGQEGTIGERVTEEEMPTWDEMDRQFTEKGLVNVGFDGDFPYLIPLKSYEIYAKECYNDSTWIETSLYNYIINCHYVVLPLCACWYKVKLSSIKETSVTEFNLWYH